MLLKFMGVTCIALALNATVAVGAEIIAQETVKKDWFEHKVRWTSGPPTYTARWKAMVKNGVVVVCGAGAFTSGNLRRETIQVLQDRAFFIDDTEYLKDITFFTKVRQASSLVGAKANCASTGKRPPRTVKKGVSLRASNPRKVY